MATTRVVLTGKWVSEMVYDGIKRYKNEAFSLIDAHTDGTLVKQGYVRLLREEEEDGLMRDDATGREFVSQMALDHYRRTAPESERTIIVRRGPGRPKGSPNKVPRTNGIKETAAAN